MNELTKRILTAIVIVGVLLFALVPGGVLGTLILVAVASALMLNEFGSIVFSLSDKKIKKTVLIAVGVLTLVFKSLENDISFPVFAISFVAISTFFLVFARTHSDHRELKAHVQEWFAAVAGIAYLGFLPSFLIKLRAVANGLNWCLLLFCIVIASDTFAYFVGRAIGKNKLYPLVSPKKSVEGLFGGVLGAVLVAGVYSHFALQQFQIVHILALGLVIGLIAPVGDLVESLLKRGFDVKDSGGILPGHGGILDRADSVVFSVPVMYAGVKLLESWG